MILYLIRHGQSTNNLLDEELKKRTEPFSFDEYMKRRVSEPPLTANGEKQADQLGTFIGSLPVAHLFCSPMLRTMQTMQPVAASLGSAPSVWVDLHEHGGIFQRASADGEAVGLPGMGRTEMAANFPGYRLDSIDDKGWWFGGEEDRAGCHARAVRVLEELYRMAQDLAADEAVAAISHGTFMDSLLKAMVGRLPGDQFYFNHHNTGITRVDFLPWGDKNCVPFFRYVNRTDHLVGDELTY